MENTVKKLNQSIEKYKAIQKKQITLFDTELMPDLGSLNFERASAFADLKNNLDRFLNMIHYEDNNDLMTFYQNQLSLLIETDGELKKTISQYKNELKQHMCDMNKSKTAFHGYAKSVRSFDQKTFGFTG